MSELKPTPQERFEALESLCHRYFEALVIDLENVRSLKAASPGVRTYDQWEKGLASIVESHPTPIISVNPTK